MSISTWIREKWATYRARRVKQFELPQYIATVLDSEIHISRPDGSTDHLDIANIRKVLVATNDSGPWSYDVWFVLEGTDNRIEFPLETDGLKDVLALLEKLPGFELRGMNSASNALFECWPDAKHAEITAQP